MPTPHPSAAPPPVRTSGLAIAGFVCAFFCSVVGLILSILGYNECKRSGGTIEGAGLALAGIIISSVVLAFGVLGVVAAVAIPAFMSYSHRSKHPEVDIRLRQLERAAKDFAAVNGAFPRGSAPLTPATACCASPDHRCFDVQSWATPDWQQLDFSIEAPHRFQYSYESDGKTFTGRAVGDPDCSGSAVSYEIQGALGDTGIASFTKRGPIRHD